MTAWRLSRVADTSAAFSGDDARRLGGRWNSPGTRMVYAAGSRSLALIEILAHLSRAAPLPLYYFHQISCDNAQVQILTTWPVGWDVEPPAASQLVGDAWIKRASHPVLEVPSALVPDERNYLLNPAHPDFHRLKLAPAQPFQLPPRLL